MKIFHFFRKTPLLFLLALLLAARLSAASESYVQTLTGHLKKGDSLTVIDDKFLNLPLDQWNQVKHLTIDDIITFELRRDTPLVYYTRPFTCTLNVTIKYYTSRDQQNPKELDSVKLVVNFDTARGKAFADVVHYRFKNAFKVTVVINSISSPEWKDKLPDVFRLTGRISVERKYPVDPKAKGAMHLGAVQFYEPQEVVAAAGPRVEEPHIAAIGAHAVNEQLPITWDAISGAEKYDLEWTWIDAQSDFGLALATTYGGPTGPFTIDVGTEDLWMRHDNTRVTVNDPFYTLNLPYQDGYVLIRIRSVWTTVDQLRGTGDWSYASDDGGAAVVVITAHQATINWQYTGTFAEEGKKKEVITYADATLRGRQTVTVNNSDLWTHDDGQTTSPTAVVEETVYDIMGRPALNVLPAPVKNSLLDYFPSFNKNSVTGQAYHALDIVLANSGQSSCAITAPAMSTTSGAAQYYSSANTFLDANNLANYYFNPYIPDAQGFPFSLTEYTPDNTGRIRRQGGVGPTLQNGLGHETNYFYGKPTPTQLQRMFGMEVGNASHYLKNMTIDPNGQASVSYIDANGKTIATALAGKPADNTQPLSSSDQTQALRLVHDVLIQPGDMTVDAGNLKMSATATFLVETGDALMLHYSVDPLALVTTYGGTNQLCNNCYYTLSVTATNDCGQVINSATTTPFQGSDYTCHTDATPIVQDLPLTNNIRPGELTVTYSLQLSNDVINAQTDYYVQTNTDLKKLQDFFQQELNALDLSGCYSTCNTCKTLPKTVDAFTAKVQSLLASSGYAGVTLTSDVQSWINTTYQTLLQKCAAISCTPVSPCEEKLDQLKQDVLPGGQYAEYNADAVANGTSPAFVEPKINVMMQYNVDPTIAALTFTADDGSTQTVGSLGQANFVRAYLQHPEWADYFVKYHVEYCGYLWCKDATNTTPADNNEVSYTFDAGLKQNYTNGADAVTAGYYNHSDPLALLNYDPWFNGGRGAAYLSRMQFDLQNLSDELNMIMKDASGNSLGGKDIIQFVDWSLYCKPIDPSATAADVTSSWTSCAPSDACRSVTMEWQTYLNYYLQLKNKYYRIAKAAYFATNPYGTVNPTCLDCFIGSDALSTVGCPPPGAASQYTVQRVDDQTNANWNIVYNNGQPFPGNYTISYYLLPGGVDDGTGSYTVQTVNVTAGATSYNIQQTALPTDGSQLPSPGTFVIGAVACTPTALGSCAASSPAGGSGPSLPCPSLGFDFGITPDPSSCGCVGSPSVNYTYSQHVFYRAGNTSPVTVTIKLSETHLGSGGALVGPEISTYTTMQLTPGMSNFDLPTSTLSWVTTGGTSGGMPGATYSSYEDRHYYIDPNSVVCNPTPPPPPLPPSTCTSNPNYALYLGKNKIFNDYIDLQDYGACLPSNSLTSSQAATSELQEATNDLITTEGTWLSRLQAIRDAEFADIAGQLPDALLTTVVSNCYQISLAYLNYAIMNGLAANVVSTLPSGVSAGAYSSFSQVFSTLIPAAALQRGFSADLLDNVYPYDKVPVLVDPNVRRLTPDIYNNVKNNLAAFQSAWNGQGSFGAYLKAQLGDDYLLSDDQLSDLQARLAGSCPNPYLANPVILPVAFVLPNPGSAGNPPVTAYVTCTQLSALESSFSSTYPTVTAGTQLYELLFTNYLNHQLGYALSYADYVNFSCPGTTFLYDKPASPTPIEDAFSCSAGLIQDAYYRGGQDYDLYIAQVRAAFRNSYISKCLSNQASTTIDANQYEYHYTLYYYDQSGNLVKTIPPEGVHLLSDQDLAQLTQLPAQDPAACAAFPTSVISNQATILSDLSTNLQNNTTESMEMWLYKNSGGTTRQVRLVTPDQKYLCQAAIANGDLWFEIYALSPDGSGGVNMTLSNRAVAAIPAQLTLQDWTHLVIQSPGGISGGDLQLYVDGNKLANLPDASVPAFPVEWEIDGITGGFVLPALDVAQVQHLRLYNVPATDPQIAADYHNACLSPVGQLTGASLQLWGVFNAPTLCNNVANATAVTIADRGSLTLTGNPNQSGTLAENTLFNVVNTFTIEFWAKPNTVDHIVDPNDPYAGINSVPPYAIFPSYGGDAPTGKAAVGIAVGTDGVSVFERAQNYLPLLLDWRGTIDKWTHIAVVYNNRTPSLYINGTLVATGSTSGKTLISPSYNFGGGGYGYMTGGLDEVRIWSVARTQAQLMAAYQQSLLPTDIAGLAGYWPMDNTNGSLFHDISCNGEDAVFGGAESWATTGAPMSETDYVPFAARLIVPDHNLATTYVNNSFNAAVKVRTPDAGTSTLQYDRLGRLSISQNAEQLQPAIVDDKNPSGRFSYTRYDALGRIVEVGEKLSAVPLSETDALNDPALQSWLASGSNRLATVTVYDDRPDWAPAALGVGYPRKRVAATALLATGSDPTVAATRLAATYYRYDLDGNVAELMQENKQLTTSESQFVTGSDGIKDIQYEYDLISGKVNKVKYQDGKWDQFYYYYAYDADNRVINVSTSRNNDLSLDLWKPEATYRYYLHGPLARLQLGELQVQGMDYAYTLQGWLKGVNGVGLPGTGTAVTDIGGDGTALSSGNALSPVARDAIGFSLGYYQGDYTPITGNAAIFSGAAPRSTLPAGSPFGTGRSLFNGNIAWSSYAISQLENGGPVGYAYLYDQLNRLTGMDRYNISGGGGTSSFQWNSTPADDYQERISYDGNGNILSYTRNGTTAGGRSLAMDNLTYSYNRVNGYLQNNRLMQIADGVTTQTRLPGDPQDLVGQPAGNYSYDNIGNLIGNNPTNSIGDNIQRINWTVYGKMASISKGGVQGLSFGYDASGHRVTKQATAADGTGTTTFYVRDAQGNVLATYQYKNNASGALTEADWSEQHLYGSSRLGMLQPNVVISAGQPYGNDSYQSGMDANIDARGHRLYELNNHLGNVLATISDNSLTVNVAGGGTTNVPEVRSAQDYYPFGMQMPGRTYIAGSSLSYRYGFNGKEKDDEVMGMGNEVDYGMRVYDPRAGRFMSIDPLQKKYPWYAPYQYAGNKPIAASDLDGLEEWMRTQNTLRVNSILQKMDDDRIRRAGTIKSWDRKPGYWQNVAQTIEKFKWIPGSSYVGLRMLFGAVDDAHVTYTNIKYGRGYATHLDNRPVSSYKELITSGVNTASLIFGGVQSLGENAVLGRLNMGQQGELGEQLFGGNLNQFRKNFGTFDNFANRIATSAKTLDLGAPTYLNRPAAITSKLNGYIDKIISFTRGTGGDFTLTASMIDTRELGLLAIGSPTSAQWSALNLSQQYAESEGVQFTLKISPLSDPLFKALLSAPKPTTAQSQSKQQ